MISAVIEAIYYSLLLFLAIKSIVLIFQNGFVARNFLSVYIICTASLELYSYTLSIFNGGSADGVLYNFYSLLSILLFYVLYLNSFKEKNIKVLRVIFFGIVIFYFCFTDFYKSDFDISIGILISLYYISVSLLWFSHKIRSFDEYKITDDPYFWISTGLLLWSCFFIFRVVPMFFLDVHDKEFLYLLRTFQNVINILMYLMLFISMMKYERQLK
ncbi:signal transduction histidine kinase [Chryseobacterium sp. JUb7]|nr:signal transduction histidine kinase [Chryseobacterium sp. JUb7]